VRRASGDHDVVYRGGEITEEGLQGGRVGRIERSGSLCAYLQRRFLEALFVAVIR
jgi:hypothetical protein